AAAAGITVAIVDKTSGTAAGAANSQFGGGGFGPGGFGRGLGGPGGGAGLMNALHGTIVVDNNGTYVTEAIQTGTVTDISATSITVASVDGYTKAYVLGASTVVDNGVDKIASVANGHTVNITATVAGDTATATQLRDQNLGTGQQRDGGRQGGPPAGNPGGQAGTGTVTS
ncbi:MAG: hypothetical protein QOI74_2291, partial [Micromonosporaceae bacterium]|nr:hypothetical protein [Micromonosporaceae bacterium]